MNKTYIPALFVLVLVLIFHLVGMEQYLYIAYSWYDIMMHFLAGAGIALASYWLIKTFKELPIYWIIIFTLIAGIVWELFEAYYGIAGFHFATTKYWIDSIKDLANDTLGALFVYIIYKKYF